MPKTGVKQKANERVKSSRSPFEKPSLANQFEEGGDVDMDGDSQGEEQVREKDESEKKLERLLFGDDEGFHSALKDHQDWEMMGVSEKSDEDEDDADKDEAGDRDLGDVADADVRCTVYLSFLSGLG